MFRIVMILGICMLLLVGCGFGKSKSFEGTMDGYVRDGGGLMVNCSDEANKGLKNVDDVGYICVVQTTDETIFADESGQTIGIEEIPQGARIEVRLTRAENIKNVKTKPKSMNLVAREIILLQ
jgi:hypothetical protein